MKRTLSYLGSPLTVSGPANDLYVQTVNLDQDAHASLHFCARSALKPSSTVIDIGANVGLTSSVFARHTDGPIYAIEPSPVAYPHLLATCAANRATEVQPRNIAFGRQVGTLRFFANDQAAAASHLITGDTLARASDIVVPVTTLDAFVADEGIEAIDFIKIDVEGFEVDVLAGGAATIRAMKPSALVEFNAFTMIAFRNINPRDLLEALRELFPYIYRFHGQTPALIGNEDHLITFIHDVLVGQGCVDDLYCTHEPVIV